MKRLLPVAFALFSAVPLLAVDPPKPAAAAEQPPAPPENLRFTPPDAVRSVTGVASKTLVAGTGDSPDDNSVVRVRYAVWDTTGKLIDRIVAPREAMLSTRKMIAGWREGIELMKEGEQRRIWVPEAAGAEGKVPAGERLVIDTELIEVIPGPKVPKDVAAPPADATLRKSGLAYVFLRHGTGTRHPKPSSTVTVHYSGWTTDGRMFDSSIQKGEPLQMAIKDFIGGWQEILPLLVEGDRVRIWVPAKLAYAHQANRPQGTLVFDMELLGTN